jgi:hypothetical protein
MIRTNHQSTGVLNSRSHEFPLRLALQEQHTAAKETPRPAEVVAELPASAEKSDFTRSNNMGKYPAW